MKTRVYIIKRKTEESNLEVVLRTLKEIPLKNFINNSETSILINPNWVCSDHSDTGNVTSTETLEGIILYLLNEAKVNPEKFVVADGGSSSFYEGVMKTNNVSKLEEYGIEIRDLNSDIMIENIFGSTAPCFKNCKYCQNCNGRKLYHLRSVLKNPQYGKNHSKYEKYDGYNPP